jgi:hypothetical protein
MGTISEQLAIYKEAEDENQVIEKSNATLEGRDI